MSDHLNSALESQLQSIGSLYVDSITKPESQSLVSLLLQSKVSQYKSLIVMKEQLEALQAQVVQVAPSVAKQEGLIEDEAADKNFGGESTR